MCGCQKCRPRGLGQLDHWLGAATLRQPIWGMCVKPSAYHVGAVAFTCWAMYAARDWTPCDTSVALLYWLSCFSRAEICKVVGGG